MFSDLHFLSKRQSSFFSKAAWLRMMLAWIKQFLVVWFDNISRILCATLAYLHIISIKNFIELFRRRKMQICQLKQSLWNICNDCLTIRRVKPYDVTVALSFYMTCARLLQRQTNVTVTTTFQGFFILFFRCIKHFLFEEFLNNLSLIILGNWLIICGGCLELLFIYNNVPFGFL